MLMARYTLQLVHAPTAAIHLNIRIDRFALYGLVISFLCDDSGLFGNSDGGISTHDDVFGCPRLD